jgi:hypothetical protein
MHITDALKIENKIISAADTSLVTASYLISLQVAKCETLYCIDKELIELPLIAACNEVSGQSVANKMKNVPLWNDMFEMAEDKELLYHGSRSFLFTEFIFRYCSPLEDVVAI